MRLFWPKSFRFLILIGFAVIALPLIIVLVSAEISMTRLALQGTIAVSNSVTVTQESGNLVEQVLTLERMARQFQVLKDLQMLETISERHTELVKTLDVLDSLLGDPEQKKALQAIMNGVNSTLEVLKHDPQKKNMLEASLGKFAQLNQLAGKINSDSQDLILHEINAMQEASEKKQRDLIIQAVVLIFLTILSMIVFAQLILRPIREMDKGIRRLGEGDYSTPVSVRGPKDLEALGGRLDWLRERLGDVEKEKSKFLAQVSHELKTPLASVREGAELLNDELVGHLNDQQKEVSKILCKNSIQLQKLIENLLGFSTDQIKLSQMFFSKVNLEDIVEEVLEDQLPAILKKEIHIESDLKNVELLGEQDKIRVIVDNLISNAVKYTPFNGRIAIRSFLEAKMGVFEVADSGPGIPEVERGKIFQPFYQGEAPLHGMIKGTGLGLSIAKEYVLEQGGRIIVKNSRSGGACFQVSLPLVIEEQKV
jgi:two-component system, NtrC family, sensor histidine kinase GlrK